MSCQFSIYRRFSPRLSYNKHSLEFKQVTQKQLACHLKKLNKKKSLGLDGLSQEHLILGAKNLVCPLTTIVNTLITSGMFPTMWKEAVVMLVLKKGNSTQLNIITKIETI